MFDFQNGLHEAEFDFRGTDASRRHITKAIFDVLMSVLLLVPLVLITLILIVLNPLFNAGPVVFLQKRMGLDGYAFTAIKFRTMRESGPMTRGAFDALETDRISALGRILRKTRIDELPQIINVLRGEMSLIGPRPDAYEHAVTYLQTVPGYAQRHRVLPGISGYAQTEVGYVEAIDGVQRKVMADLYYISHASFGFDLWITWRTLCVVFGRKGS